MLLATQVFWEHRFSFLYSKSKVVELLDPVLRIFLTLWEAAKLFPKAVVLFCVSPFMCESVTVASHACQQ